MINVFVKKFYFLNYDFKNWRVGAIYEKYQPVYFETQKDSLIKNFFYAKQTHTASYDNLPTNENFWTQDFFYENDFGLSVNTEPTIDYLNFKNSFTQRIKSQDNIHSFKKIDLSKQYYLCIYQMMSIWMTYSIMCRVISGI